MSSGYTPGTTSSAFAWIAGPAFQNAWVNYGGGQSPAGYGIDGLGFVHLRGLIKSGLVASGTIIFTLPAGYRPEYEEIFCVSSNDGAETFGRVDVLPNGNVVINKGGNAFLSLDSICFKQFA